jgi:hypothetical protein
MPGGSEDWTALHIETLFRELNKGVKRFLADIDEDPEMQDRVEQRGARLYGVWGISMPGPEQTEESA